MRAGLHRTYMGAIERGEQNVSLENIWLIADALGVGATDLFRESEAGNSQRAGPP